MTKDILHHIALRTQLDSRAIKNTVELLSQGATIPFISRYRKEATGSLDEIQIESIKLALDSISELVKRREYILKTIAEQGKLSPGLKSKIENCWDETRLEDLYLPYKKKRKTKATVAKEQGLEPLAKMIWDQRSRGIKQLAKKYLNEEISSVTKALEGAQFIISEWISESTSAREKLRKRFQRESMIHSKLVKSKKSEAEKYTDYFDFSESLKKCPSHRFLAIMRGESEGFLRVKIDVDFEETALDLKRIFIKGESESKYYLEEALNDALKRLMMPSMENEFRKSAKERADKEAIKVFSENLRQLLLAAPLGSKRLLAIDPGFRTGCKIVCLDQNGDLLYNTAIYPHPPQESKMESEETIKHLLEHYNIEIVAIGNGTAGKETLAWLNRISLPTNPELYLINESGASIYSASAIAREEFPDHDLTVRGAVSIGRRLMDPLAELVKLDAKSIGVGQYQHDVNQTRLKESLDRVVESCVNTVGINLNTASKHLLTYVSGLGPTLAQNIVDYRADHGSFNSRTQLKKVPRMGSKAFQQAAGFLRIKEAKNPLDNTAVHPESYALVKQIANDQNKDLKNLMQDASLKNRLNLNKYISDKIGLPTLKDILKELEKPGLDPRGVAAVFHFTKGVETLSDLSEGMIVNGLINNITKFGAFVDIGIKESGLIHISQITDRFIKDPAEVLKLSQEVRVKIIAIDKERKRISLSMKGL